MPLRPLSEENLEQILLWFNLKEGDPALSNNYELNFEAQRSSDTDLKGNLGFQSYLFCDKADSAIGIAYFTSINTDHQTASWGFCIRPDAPKSTIFRLGLEAIDFAFSVMQLHKLNSEILSTSFKSINLYKKLGFREEGRFREQHYDGSKHIDIVLMGITIDEWQLARDHLALRVSSLEEKAIKSLRLAPSREKYDVVILSDSTSWINSFIFDLEFDLSVEGHNVIWEHNIENVLARLRLGGSKAAKANKTSFCFCLSYSKVLSFEFRSNFNHTLIVHESDLPKGKGWSPLTWQIIEGKNSIGVCLIEAVDRVDSGPIYAMEIIHFDGGELVDELREVQAKATIKLCNSFVENYPNSIKNAKIQNGDETFYSRRFPEDSRLDVEKTIIEQFNLLRTVDNDRYPAFFEIKNRRYYLALKSQDSYD